MIRLPLFALYLLTFLWGWSTAFVFSAELTDQQQVKHDAAELAMYTRLQADENAIADIWRPSPKLVSDYRAARRCYRDFHLYKVESCEKELSLVDRDLSIPRE